jgi:hypothetical protein
MVVAVTVHIIVRAAIAVAVDAIIRGVGSTRIDVSTAVITVPSELRCTVCRIAVGDGGQRVPEAIAVVILKNGERPAFIDLIITVIVDAIAHLDRARVAEVRVVIAVRSIRDIAIQWFTVRIDPVRVSIAIAVMI